MQLRLLVLTCALALPAQADTQTTGPAAPIQTAPPAMIPLGCPPCPCAEEAGRGYPPFPAWLPPFGQPPVDFFPSQGNGPDFGPPAGRSGPLRVERNADENEYNVKIFLNGQKPENVRVTSEGRWLVVNTGDTQDDSRQYNGAAYRSYSFQRSYGSAQRRFTLPPDADIANMTRSDSDGLVELHIPRQR